MTWNAWARSRDGLLGTIGLFPASLQPPLAGVKGLAQVWAFSCLRSNSRCFGALTSACTSSSVSSTTFSSSRASNQLGNAEALFPSATQVPEGYNVDVFIKDLTYPTSIEFDSRGAAYIAEAGYSYGDASANPRILRVAPDGSVEVAASDGLSGPVNDLLWHDGRLYVSHRGKISALGKSGEVEDLVTGLPSAGDHQNNQLTAGPDGKLCFGQGTATNSGVVGMDNYKMGWLKDDPEFHDVPAEDITIAGRTYTTPNPRHEAEERAVTSSFHAFGQATEEPRELKGAVKSSGTILRMNADGSDLEVYAWGLRNPFESHHHQ